MTIYRRTDSEAWDEAAAAAVGLLVGAAAFYVARLWFQREELTAPPEGKGGARRAGGQDTDGKGRPGVDPR